MTQPTRAQRLDAIVARVAPKAVAYYQQYGKWPNPDAPDVPPDESIARRLARILRDLVTPSDDDQAKARTLALEQDGFKRHAPYEIKPVAAGRFRVIVTDDDGGTVAGAGATVEEALTALEATLR